MNEKLIVEQIAGMRWQVKRYGNGTIRGSGFTKEQAKRDFLAQEIAFTTNAQANGFIRLAPDEVVIKRATAEHAKCLSDRYHCDNPDCYCGECEADLERALEQSEKSVIPAGTRMPGDTDHVAFTTSTEEKINAPS